MITSFILLFYNIESFMQKKRIEHEKLETLQLELDRKRFFEREEEIRSENKRKFIIKSLPKSQFNHKKKVGKQWISNKNYIVYNA